MSSCYVDNAFAYLHLNLVYIDETTSEEGDVSFGLVS